MGVSDINCYLYQFQLCRLNDIVHLSDYIIDNRDIFDDNFL